jgi:hypothetical protein
MAVLAGTQPPIDPPRESNMVARVLSVSLQPPDVPGRQHRLVRVTARAGRETVELFFPYRRPRQPLPAVGATCAITFIWPFIDGAFGPNGEQIRSSMIMTSYRCGNDPMVVTGP